MSKYLKKIISLLLSFIMMLQAGGMLAFADSVTDYSDDMSDKNQQALISFAVGENEIPTDGGIWLNPSSKDCFLSIINNLSSQSYSVDSDGYLHQNITDKSAVNDYDKKLKRIINSSKTLIVSVSDVYKAYNYTLGEEYFIMLDDSDFTLLFEMDKISAAVLNYYHYAEHRDEYTDKYYTDKELLDEFLKAFYPDKSEENKSAENESFIQLPEYYSGVRLPIVNTYAGFTTGVYGKSGLGEDLRWYRIGHGPNVVLAVFAQHGWEDAWSSDGAELVKIADRVMSNLSSVNQGIFSDWSVYIIPYANPDGITNGYTNNGPGRCTVTTKIDMNRCWPASFKASYTDRNYTGSSALGAPEAKQLESFLSSRLGSYTNVVLDVHGWLNQTIGNPDVGKYFCNQFGFSHKLKNGAGTHGSGYLETWAYNKGAKSCLVEFPMPKNSSSIISNDYSGKFTRALVNLMNDFTDEKPITLGNADNLRVKDVTGISAKVSWNAASFAEGYRVELLSSAHGQWQSVGTTTKTEFTISNLAFDHNYSFRIIPYRNSKNGMVYSGSHSCGFTTLSTDKAASSIGRIEFLNLRNITDTSVEIIYPAVHGANMYRIEYSSDKINWQTAVNTAYTDKTAAVFEPASEYYIRVTAYAESGSDTAMSEKYSPVYHLYTSPENVPLSQLPFTDLNNSADYSGYIEYTSVLNKFITGTNPPERTLFSPYTPITRAMFVTILYRMAGNPYDESNPHTASPFDDIKDIDTYYYNAACWALDNGITNQITFRPYDNVSREQTAAFLFRYAKENNLLGDADYKNISLKGYADSDSIKHWAEEAMQWANYNSMITGTKQGYANPQGETQRVHAAKILYGFGKTCGIGNFE